MKKLVLILCTLFSLSSAAYSQTIFRIEDKTFNFGAKLGVNSIFPIVNSLTIDGVSAENVRLQYKVGYQASAFFRINFDRFFIQPELSWCRTNGDIRFSLPPTIQTDNNLSPPETTPMENDQLKLKISSLELPVMIGYYLVREGPYALSMMVGPKIKYNYKVRYTSYFSDMPREYINDNTPFGIGIITGLGTSIGRLFFDITYEFGLNQVESDFKDKSSLSPIERNITIDKRTNMMQFSLGFLF